MAHRPRPLRGNSPENEDSAEVCDVVSLVCRVAAPERCDRVLDRREDSVVADLLGQAEAIELGAHGVLDGRDREDHVALFQGGRDLDDRLTARVVDVVSSPPSPRVTTESCGA